MKDKIYHMPYGLTVCLAFLLSSTGIKAQEFTNPTRTEYKDNASLPGSKSGFFQTENPVNYPTGASKWWHLLDVRHISTTYNYAMQFAGSFYDQELYFRKINNNASQTWRKIPTIGTDNVLNVSGAVYAPQYTVRTAGQVDKVNNSTWYGMGLSNLQLEGAPTDGPTVVQMAGYFGLNLKTSGGQLVVTRGGNVGINTTSPSKTLSVNGTILAKEIIVKSSNSPDWPDYVFHRDYRLPSPDSLSAAIGRLGHLPGMPSASEVRENGVSLGEMNRKLLEKVEELTLLLIGQDREIKQLRDSQLTLDNAIKEIKANRHAKDR